MEEILKTFGLGHLAEAFTNHNISSDILFDLTEEHLQQLIPNIGDQTKFKKGLQQLQIEQWKLHDSTYTSCSSSSRQPCTQPCTTSGITEITDFLYLSGALPLTPTALELLGVTCVINAAGELPDTPLPDTAIDYFKLGVRDTAHDNLHHFFDLVADLIHQADCLQGKTLVHCVAGVSRSASLCLAYLIKYQGLSLREAYAVVKERRPAIKPNVGFFEQLIQYERERRGATSVEMVFNEMLNTHIPDVYHEEYEHLRKMRDEYRK